MSAGNKAELRRYWRSQRLALLPEAEGPLLAAAERKLPPLLPAGRRLGLYWPLRGEADLRPLAQLSALQGQLALPRVQGGQLHYRAWQPGDPLSSDDTRIAAPAGGADLEPAALGLLLVPALALNRQGIRLGYGGGWFDRLRSDPAWRQVPALAVLPAGCLCEELPVDPWDVPFDGWLDQHGVHWLQPVSGSGAATR